MTRRIIHCGIVARNPGHRRDAIYLAVHRVAGLEARHCRSIVLRHGRKQRDSRLGALRRWWRHRDVPQVDANVSRLARPPAAVFIAFSGNILRLDTLDAHVSVNHLVQTLRCALSTTHATMGLSDAIVIHRVPFLQSRMKLPLPLPFAATRNLHEIFTSSLVWSMCAMEKGEESVSTRGKWIV